MKVNGPELFITIEAGLAEILPLPEALECCRGWLNPVLTPERRWHAQLSGWCEASEGAGMPQFGR